MGEPIVIPLIGQFNSGKTTTSTLLRDILIRDYGMTVANVLYSKGINDLMAHYQSGSNLYFFPLEAVKGRRNLEQWLPVGYDAYIIESAYPHHPEWVISDMLVNILNKEEQNEVIPYTDYRNGQDTSEYQMVITKAPKPIDKCPTVLTNKELHNESFFKVTTELTPRMVMPVSRKEVIGIGYFPGELRHIYPSLNNGGWYGFDYASFFKRYLQGDFDMAIIGYVHDGYVDTFRGFDHPTVCFYPPAFVDGLKPISITGNLHPDQETSDQIREVLRTKPVGTPLPVPPGDIPPEQYFYYKYSNERWCRREYYDLPLYHKIGNVTCLNGIVHPKYLIDDGIIII